MLGLPGIDVSAAGQGAAFPWESYRGRIAWAGIKISEDLDFIDPDAKRNIEGCRSIGAVPVGYHFLHANAAGGPQAEFFLAHAHAAGLAPGDLIAMDAEDGGLDGQPASQMNLAGAGFWAQLQRHFPGYNPLTYTEISMAPSLVSLGHCPLWLANPSGTRVVKIGPWAQVSFEQTSQQGVDQDVFYGSSADLAKLAIPK